MADIIDNQRTILHRLFNGHFSLRIPLAPWCADLRVSVQVNFGHLEIVVRSADGLSVLITVLHVNLLCRPAIAIHVISNENNPIAPFPKLPQRIIQAAVRGIDQSLPFHISSNLVHVLPRLLLRTARNPPDADGQFVSDAFAVLRLQEPEIIITDIAARGADGVFRLIGNNVRGVLRQISIHKSSVPHQLQITGHQRAVT